MAHVLTNADAPDVAAPAAPEGVRYVRLLGRGASSEVWEGEDLRFGVHYAFKIFTPRAKGDVSVLRDRFLAEGKLLVKLDHPRIARVRAYGTDPLGRPFYAMDLVRGPKGAPHTLADAKRAGVDEERVAAWYDDIREGLAYIHGCGIVHRDLKLQNVLVGADGRAVLTDFGAASVESKTVWADAGDTLAAAAMRGGATVMGTVGYMPPEAALGVAASPATDYYALGVLVYHLLTGSWCDARTDLRGQLEGYAEEWLEILPKLLHANPAARTCPDRRAWLAERAAALAGAAEASAARRAVVLRRLRRQRRLFGAAAAVLAVGCAALLAIGFGSEPEPIVTFEDVCTIPESATDGADGTLSREDYETALTFVWTELHQAFADLRAGRISYAKARDDARRLAAGEAEGSAEHALYMKAVDYFATRAEREKRK